MAIKFGDISSTSGSQNDRYGADEAYEARQLPFIPADGTSVTKTVSVAFACQCYGSDGLGLTGA